MTDHVPNATGTASITRWASFAEFEGHRVMVSGDGPCDHPDLDRMLHDGQPGTGFLWCPDCAGTADDPTYFPTEGASDASDQ